MVPIKNGMIKPIISAFKDNTLNQLENGVILKN
jgi:hypothetical protein